MAHVYVDSAAAGAGTGADWANAYTTITAAVAGAAVAGNTFWIAHTHAESTAGAVSIAAPGTQASPCTFICVNKAGSVPPVSADFATTATITTTGNSAISIAPVTDCSNYWRGVTFNCGSGAVNAAINIHSGAAADGYSEFELCNFNKAGTTAVAGAVQTATNNTGVSNRVLLRNCKMQVGSTGDVINIRGHFTWINTPSAISGATLPTGLFTIANGCNAVLRGIDLSAIAGTLVNTTSDGQGMNLRLENCKLHASLTIPNPLGPGDHRITLFNSDGADTNYRNSLYAYEGTQSVETTIVRTGGATDGTTPIAWKIVTTANSEFFMPFESMPISIWNETSGSAITVTVQGIWDGGAVPDNGDIWMEVSYIGDASFPLGSDASSRKADLLATAAGYAAGDGTWGGSTTKFKMAATFTPQAKGPITIRIFAALVSSTFYIDPEPEISGVTVSKSSMVAPGVYINEISTGAGGGTPIARPGLHAIEQGLSA